MKEKKLNAIIDKVFGKCLKTPKKCIIESCNENAIKSHLLQKNGIINLIAENQHVRQVSYDKFPHVKYKIKLIGVNQALSFKGFCSYHDANLFRPIEAEEIDFNDYKNQLLFSYRALLKEYRDKELMVDFFTYVLNTKIDGFFKDVEGLKTVIIGQRFMMWDLEFDMKCIYEDLNSTQQSFNFITLFIPKIDVCASATFSYSSLAENLVYEDNSYKKTEPMPAVIVNLIPTLSDTKFIIGYNKVSEKHIKDKVDKLQKLDQKKLLKEINDLLIRNFEMWACSDSFYQQNIKSRELELTRLMNFYTRENQFSPEPISFNIFD